MIVRKVTIFQALVFLLGTLARGMHVPSFNGTLNNGQISNDQLKKMGQEILAQERLRLNSKLIGVNLLDGEKLDNSGLILERGGVPLRNIIVTTWRSGSNFLGETLSSHPGTFYFNEPLRVIGFHTIENAEKEERALNLLRSELNCVFPEVQSDSNIPKIFEFGVFVNEFWTRYCSDRPELCSDFQFQAAMCRLFPVQLAKIVRLKLSAAERILEDPTLDAKVLFLVRDPRGTLSSRIQIVHFVSVSEEWQPNIFCPVLMEDFRTAQRLQMKYPTKFMVIRYEDLALQPYPNTERILNFFGLQMHPQVRSFLESHTVEEVGGHLSTYRNSSENAFDWRSELALNIPFAMEIEANCREALAAWGYAPIYNLNRIRTFNPLRRPPWPVASV